MSSHEIIKIFTNQISSLKKLIYNYNPHSLYRNYYNISFTYSSWMRDLSELRCSTNLPSDFFYQLSQICHNLQSLSINFYIDDVSNELKELISLQNNLKNLTLYELDKYYTCFNKTL